MSANQVNQELKAKLLSALQKAVDEPALPGQKSSGMDKRLGDVSKGGGSPNARGDSLASEFKKLSRQLRSLESVPAQSDYPLGDGAAEYPAAPRNIETPGNRLQDSDMSVQREPAFLGGKSYQDELNELFPSVLSVLPSEGDTDDLAEDLTNEMSDDVSDDMSDDGLDVESSRASEMFSDGFFASGAGGESVYDLMADLESPEEEPPLSEELLASSRRLSLEMAEAANHFYPVPVSPVPGLEETPAASSPNLQNARLEKPSPDILMYSEDPLPVSDLAPFDAYPSRKPTGAARELPTPRVAGAPVLKTPVTPEKTSKNPKKNSQQEEPQSLEVLSEDPQVLESPFTESVFGEGGEPRRKPGKPEAGPDILDTKSDFDATLSYRRSEQEAVAQTESKAVKSRQNLNRHHRAQGVKLKNNEFTGGSMTDLSGYKDLSKAPLFEDDAHDHHVSHSPAVTAGNKSRGFEPSLSPETFSEMNPDVDTEFSGNVQTLIRLVSELPEGVTKQTGAQIIRLTMEAMGISMEDVLSEAQSAQSEMLDAVRANIKKIEEYKTVIRKLETDIKYYQGKANELSEIIDLFILSNTSAKAPNVDELTS